MAQARDLVWAIEARATQDALEAQSRERRGRHITQSEIGGISELPPDVFSRGQEFFSQHAPHCQRTIKVTCLVLPALAGDLFLGRRMNPALPARMMEYMSVKFLMY